MKTPQFAETGQDLSRDYPRYVEALLAGDMRICHDIIKSLVESNLGLRSIYENFIRRSLYEVGDLWMGGWVSVATEHLATAITESLLETAEAVRRRFPALPILVGGQGFQSAGRERAERISGVRFLASLAELESWMQSSPLPLAHVA